MTKDNEQALLCADVCENIAGSNKGSDAAAAVEAIRARGAA